MGLVFQAITEILRVRPSLIYLVSLEDSCNDTGNVFGDEFSVEQDRVECDLVPSDVLDLVRKPHLCRFNDCLLDRLMKMALSHEIYIEDPFS